MVQNVIVVEFNTNCIYGWLFVQYPKICYTSSIFCIFPVTLRCLSFLWVSAELDSYSLDFFPKSTNFIASILCEWENVPLLWHRTIHTLVPDQVHVDPMQIALPSAQRNISETRVLCNGDFLTVKKTATHFYQSKKKLGKLLQYDTHWMQSNVNINWILLKQNVR